MFNLFVSIIGVYLTHYYGKAQISQSEFDKFRNYLNEISVSLNKMVEKLNQNEVPTEAGNRLAKALENFEALYEDLNLKEDTRIDLTYAHEKLNRHLLDGIFLDDVIRGNILNNNLGKKDEILNEMKRTSGYLQGIALGLKPAFE